MGFIVIFFLCFLFFDLQKASAAGTDRVAVGINDALVEYNNEQVKMIQYTSYSPIEPFLKALEVNFSYDVNNKQYIAKKNGKGLRISLTTKTIKTMDGTVLQAQVKNIDGTARVPMRIISNFFDYEIKYLAEHKLVRIYDGRMQKNDADFIATHKEKINHYFNSSKQKKVVYFTFDDGPNQYTPLILDILKKKEAKATFFMIEGNMKKYPNTVKRIVKEGNFPALHSVTHNKDKLYKGSSQNVALEMEQSRKTLLSISGVNSYLTRAPYGSKPYMTEAHRNHLNRYHFKMWDWNIDTEDWKYGKSNPRKIVAKVKNGLQELEGTNKPIVILFHDSKGTASVLAEIIDYVRQKGYEPIPYSPDNHKVVNYWGDTRL